MADREFRFQRHGRWKGASILSNALAVLVHSNIWIAIGATGVAVSTVGIVGVPWDPLPFLVVFVCAFLGYGFNRITDLSEDSVNLPARSEFVAEYGRRLLWVAGGLFLGIAVLAVRIRPEIAPILLVPLLGTVIYSVGRLKRVFLVKNLLVGAVWAAIPLGIGLYHGVWRSPELLVVVFVVGILLTVAAAIFDIKDIEGDQAHGIRTVPVVYGPRNTRRLAAATAFAVIPIVLTAAWTVTPMILVLLVLVAYVLGYIPFATPERGPIFYGFLVDGEHVALALVVMAVHFVIP